MPPSSSSRPQNRGGGRAAPAAANPAGRSSGDGRGGGERKREARGFDSPAHLGLGRGEKVGQRRGRRPVKACMVAALEAGRRWAGVAELVGSQGVEKKGEEEGRSPVRPLPWAGATRGGGTTRAAAAGCSVRCGCTAS